MPKPYHPRLLLLPPQPTITWLYSSTFDTLFSVLGPQLLWPYVMKSFTTHTIIHSLFFCLQHFPSPSGFSIYSILPLTKLASDTSIIGCTLSHSFSFHQTCLQVSCPSFYSRHQWYKNLVLSLKKFSPVGDKNMLIMHYGEISIIRKSKGEGLGRQCDKHRT